MAERKYVAIKFLCKILEGFPESRKLDAISFACHSVGRSPDPTGIKPTPDKPLKHLAWDLTADDLQHRLIKIVDSVDILEKTLVLGVVGYLDSHYAKQADRDFAERTHDNQVQRITDLQEQLKLPQNERAHNAPDKETHDFIETLKNMLSETEQRRQEAEEALAYLRESVDSIFTYEFWDAYSMCELGKIDLSSQFDEDEEED